MSVQSQIDRINENVANTYSVLEGYGAEMPHTRNTANLAETAADIKAVLYKAQTLTAEQKTQARENIDAAGVYVGSAAPTDESVQFWIDPTAEPEETIEVYSKEETEALVANAIRTAIGNAMGGSY